MISDYTSNYKSSLIKNDNTEILKTDSNNSIIIDQESETTDGRIYMY